MNRISHQPQTNQTIDRSFDIDFDEIDQSPSQIPSAIETLKSYSQGSPITNLRKNRINPWRHTDPASTLQPGARSVAARILWWMSNTKLAIFAGVNFSRFLFLMGAPSQNTRSQIDRAVDELSGSMHLSKTLHSISPALTIWVQKMLMELNIHGLVNQFMKDEHWTLQKFVDALLPVIYVNMANNIKENSISNGDDKIVVTLVDILSFAVEIIEVHLPYINARIDAVNSIEDPVRRDKKLCQLFGPIVEDFIAVALPNGFDELPLMQVWGISGMVWESVLKQMVPKIFIEVHRQFASPLNNNKKDLLIQKPGGDSLAAVAKMAGEKAAVTLPQFLAGARTEFDDNGFVSIEGTPVVSALIKRFCSLLEGSDHLKNWLATWFADLLSAFGRSSDYHVKLMWKLLAGYIEPILIHVFENMSRMPSEPVNGRTPDVLGIILIRFFSITSVFFSANQVTISDRVEVLRKTGEKMEEDPVLLAIFKPYAINLLECMGLLDPNDLPLPDFSKKIVAFHLKEIAPEFLLRQYFAITESKIDDGISRNKLRSLLFDPSNLQDPSVATKVVTALFAQGHDIDAQMFNSFYKELWQESGTERVAKTLEGMCAKVAGDLYASVLGFFGISAQEMLKENNSIFMKRMGIYMKSIVETALLETVVNITETSGLKDGQEEQNSKALGFAHLMVRLIGILDRGLTGVEEKAKEIKTKYPDDILKVIQETNKTFNQLAAELHAFGGINPFKYLPLDAFPGGETIKEMLWGTIKDVVLPDISRRVYMQLTEWECSIEESYKDLEGCYHTTHASWACRVIAQYATDYIKHYLTSSNDEAAHLMLESMNRYFANSQENPNLILCDDQMEPFLSDNIKAFAKSQEGQVTDLWHALAKYNEAIIAKFFAEISKTIRDVEQSNPDFILDVVLQVIKDTTEHFSVVSRAAEEAGEEFSYKVKPSVMFAAFGEKLHDGVPLDPEAADNIKSKTRLQGCFIPMADKLLELAKLSSKDLPFPSVFREQLGGLLLEQILPLALMQIYKKAMEPQVRDSLMLNFVQTLYAALSAEANGVKADPIEEVEAKPDPKSKHLYEICGSLVLELIKLVPDTAVQYVFMKEKVKNMSAEAIGDAMMPFFSERTLLQLIDKLIYVGLPMFHPSKWEGKLGNQALIPRKAFLRPDGKLELKPVKKFKFDFSGTSYELDAQKKVQEQEATEVRSQLQEQFTKTISQQLHARAWAFVKSLWHSLQGHFNDFIEGIFPEKGPKMKAYADKVFHLVFFDLIGTVVQFVTMPLVKVFKLAIEKALIDKRSQEVIKNIQSETIENLFYKWTDSVIDSLLKSHRARYAKKPAG